MVAAGESVSKFIFISNPEPLPGECAHQVIMWSVGRMHTY